MLALSARAGGVLGVLTQALSLASAFVVTGDRVGYYGPAASLRFGAPLTAGTFSCASYGCLNAATNGVNLDAVGLAANVLSIAAVCALLGAMTSVRFPAWGITIGAVAAVVEFMATGFGPELSQSPVPANESFRSWIAALVGTGGGAGLVWALHRWANWKRARVARSRST